MHSWKTWMLFRVLPLPASTPTQSFLFLPITPGKSGNWFFSFNIRDGLVFDSCGLKRQALCGSAMGHLCRHLSPYMCSETNAGRFSVEAAQIVHHTRPPVLGVLGPWLINCLCAWSVADCLKPSLLHEETGWQTWGLEWFFSGKNFYEACVSLWRTSVGLQESWERARGWGTAGWWFKGNLEALW